MTARLLALLLLLAPRAAGGTEATPVASQVKRATQELLSAVASGDWAVREKYLDESILYTAEDGRTLTKAQLREEMKPHLPGYSGSIEVESGDVRVYDETAVVSHEDLEKEEIFGEKLVARHYGTDTWIRRDGRWRLVASQVLVRLQDPPPGAVDRLIDRRDGRDVVWTRREKKP